MDADRGRLAEKVISCPICDSVEICPLWSDTIRIADKSYSYSFLKCGRCNLHFMYPLPDQSTIDAFYHSLERDKAYGPYRFHNRSVGEKYSAIKIWIAESRFPEKDVTLGKKFRKVVALIAECLAGRLVSFSLGIPLQYPFGASMLDVGCGAGDWLIAMKQAGYRNIIGQDIAGPSLQRLKEHGINVVIGDLRDLGLPASSFDLIRMEHVLEHLPDPVAYVCEVQRLLRPGGRLVINIPCIDSLSFRLAGRHWNALQPLHHLHHFSPLALKFLAKRAGLHLLRYRRLPVYEQMVASVSFKLGAGITRHLMMKPVRAVIGPLYSLSMRVLGTGDFLTAEFMKPLDTAP